ncbi:MAG: lytic murein transglycosylase [Aeromicrobium sp.]
MGARKLTRWQKASALVPMAILVGAWGAALNSSSFATASDGTGGGDVPDVPSAAFEQPASVQSTPGGIDQRAGLAGTVATLSTNGIPSSALFAYRRTETLLDSADASCKLPWNLIAAIGRVESNHGRSNGNSLDADGVAKPGIYGVPLDGNDGRAKIGDTDNGALDKNSVYDRAIGPMQFIPSTWKSVAVDSDNDGMKNPQDIDDAATAAGIYLCAGPGDLSTQLGASEAVARYNHSQSYVDLVLQVSAAYAQGEFTQSPDGFSSATVLTSQSNDQTLTPDQRKKAKSAENKANKPPKSTGGTGGGTDPGTGGGTDPGTGGGGTGGGGGTTSGGLTGLVDGLLGDLSGGGTPTTESSTMTWAQAKVQCLLDPANVLNGQLLTNCIAGLLS